MDRPAITRISAIAVSTSSRLALDPDKLVASEVIATAKVARLAADAIALIQLDLAPGPFASLHAHQITARAPDPATPIQVCVMAPQKIVDLHLLALLATVAI